MGDETRGYSSNHAKQLKLLSLVVTGRNDNYMGNFKYRLTTCINYIARNLKDLGRLDDVEILVTDWNSDVPLSKVLVLTPEARQICRFVYVSPKVTLEKQRPDQVFNGPCAINVSLRRAQGKFSMIMPADILFPSLSLRILLELLDGDLAIPFKFDSCLFLCSRKRIPWDMVHREPGLDKWDQYLLLNGGELERGRRWPGIGVSCSALMMHSPLWYACHGFDEQLSYWGWSDAELTLRITQYYPWMELLSIGVVAFEMGHPRQNRGVSRPQKTNPHIVHLSFTVNDENWGLGDYELDMQTSENICKLPGAGKPSGRPSSIKPWDKTRAELFAELTGQEVQEHLQATIQSWWNVNPAEWAGLCAVAWYSLYRYPGHYLEFGIRNGYAAAVVAAACPSVEIYGVDSWQAMDSKPARPPDYATGLLHSIGYQGYLRLVTGDPHTAFKRLKHSLGGRLSLDLVLVRGDMFGADAAQQLSDLVSHLVPRGMLVFMCSSVDSFRSGWSEMRAKFPHFTYLQCKTGKTGLILAASLRNDKLYASSTGNNLQIDFGKPPPSGLVRQFRRVYHALRNPAKYPEYAKRICGLALGYLLRRSNL